MMMMFRAPAEYQEMQISQEDEEVEVVLDHSHNKSRSLNDSAILN
jgi:hypothetical protein